MMKYIINFLFSNPFKETSYTTKYINYTHNNFNYMLPYVKYNYKKDGHYFPQYGSKSEKPTIDIYHFYIEVENNNYILDGDNAILVNLDRLNAKDQNGYKFPSLCQKTYDDFIRPEIVPTFKGVEDIYTEFYKRYPTKSIKEISFMVSQEIEKRQRNTGIYNQKAFIEYLYKLFLFLPKGVTYGSFCLLKDNKEELIKATDIKSLFIFVLEYFLKDHPTDEIIFLFNYDNDNPYNMILNKTNNLTTKIQDKFETILYADTNNNLEFQPLIGFLSVKREKNGKYLISGNALNYSVKSYNIINNEKINIQNCESGTYDYNSMMLILNNIVEVTNTKYIIYKHNVMEKDFGLNMVIDDLINTN